MDTETKDTTRESLAQIEATAARVGMEYDAHQEAICVERDAEALVLERAIEAARPALRAVADRIVTHDAETSGWNGCNPVEERDYHAQRGLVLVDEYDSEGDGSGNRGTLGGRQLVLLVDATLALLVRDGEWSHWQGEWDRYDTTLEAISARRAMDLFELDECLAALAKALTEQAGQRDAKAARERAERLAALAALAK